jgi:hypothetical protein
MPLTWNVEKCKNVDKIINKGGDENSPNAIEWCITEKLIWMSMSCGYYQITKKNYEEIWFRISLQETYDGNHIGKWSKKHKCLIDYYITLEDVKNRIGLHTNASSATTKQFFNKLLKDIKGREYGVRVRESLINPPSPHYRDKTKVKFIVSKNK